MQKMIQRFPNERKNKRDGMDHQHTWNKLNDSIQCLFISLLFLLICPEKETLKAEKLRQNISNTSF